MDNQLGAINRDDLGPAIIIDNGSGVMKAGLASDEAPRAVFRNVVGKPKVPGIMIGLDQKEVYVGTDALKRRGILNISQPVR